MPMLTLANGARLSYGEAGAGIPLVLVHGSPGDGRAWARVLQRLPPHYRTLTPDLPGYGSSDAVKVAPAERTRALASAVGALIEHCADPVWLCGHSYGGNVALHAALQRRERVKGLLLLEPVFMHGLELAGEHDVLQRARAFFMFYADRVDSGEPDAVAMMIDYWFGAGAFPKLPAPVQEFLKGAAPKNALDVRAAFAESVTAAELAAFDRPVIIASGATSPPVAPAIAVALGKLLPRAEVFPVPGATHGMLDTHPEAVAALVQRLRGVRM